MSIEISVVTGTYNRLPHLQAMIASARASVHPGIAVDFVVVDGGSSDGTLEWLTGQRDVQVIQHGELRGAIRAFNDGAYAARGRYVVLANDDVTFVGKSLTRALVYMDDHPDVGVGAFYQDREHRPMHVNYMPAVTKHGQATRVLYAQVAIVPRWLGDKLHWWELSNARTYGGDCALSARCWEHNYLVEAIENCQIHDSTVADGLREVNHPVYVGTHPDTRAYYSVFPNGPHIGSKAMPIPPPDATSTRRRILYAPIYEPGNRVQHEQKRGLRRALQRIGLVYEIDYLAGESVVEAAELWQPDLTITQFHDADKFNAKDATRLLKVSKQNVNWIGDQYDRSDNADYIDMLTGFDYQLVVNDSAAANYRAQGVRAAYWQIGYEPDGVGYEPDEGTARHDLLFLANNYSPERLALGQFLKRRSFNTGVYGSGWPVGMASGESLYDFRAGCKLYRAAKIAISDNQWKTDARGFVSNRLFQALAAGGALVFQRRFEGMTELLGLCDGVHLVVWADEADLLEKAGYYLKHEDERARIALMGHAECLRNHSFEARVNQLTRMLVPPPPEEREPELAIFHSERRNA